MVFGGATGVPPVDRRGRQSLHIVTSSLKRVIVRLFIALDIDDAIRERMAGFMDGLRGFAPDVRWVRTLSTLSGGLGDGEDASRTCLRDG